MNIDKYWKMELDTGKVKNICQSDDVGALSITKVHHLDYYKMGTIWIRVTGVKVGQGHIDL